MHFIFTLNSYPQLTWFKDNLPLTASSRFETDYNPNNGIGILKINNTLKNDIGDYLVLAENKAGNAHTSCQLRIQLVPNVDENSMINPDSLRLLASPLNHITPEHVDTNKRLIPPCVIIPLSNVKINEGESVRLASKIDGFPKPKVA